MPATADPDILSLFPPGRFEYTPAEPMSEDEFFELCQKVDPHVLERAPNGTIVVMPPAGSYSSNRSLRIASQLQKWTDKNEEGAVFDSSGGFSLPNGAIRAPDAAWVSSDRLAALSEDEKEQFLPLAPDFAVEVRTPSDRRADLEAKMTEYDENGTRLGWLVDPKDKTVSVYHEDGSVETHDEPRSLSGAPVLPDFTCDFERVWTPDY